MKEKGGCEHGGSIYVSTQGSHLMIMIMMVMMMMYLEYPLLPHHYQDYYLLLLYPHLLPNHSDCLHPDFFLLLPDGGCGERVDYWTHPHLYPHYPHLAFVSPLGYIIQTDNRGVEMR